MSQRRYRRAARTVYRIAGEVVVVQPIVALGTRDHTRRAFDLSGVAALAFLELSAQPMTVEELTNAVSASIGQSVARSDLENAATQLERSGLADLVPERS